MASVVMLIGYSIIAVPTGILGAEIGLAALRHHGGTPTPAEEPAPRLICLSCRLDGHYSAARQCKHCSALLGVMGDHDP